MFRCFIPWYDWHGFWQKNSRRKNDNFASFFYEAISYFESSSTVAKYIGQPKISTSAWANLLWSIIYILSSLSLVFEFFKQILFLWRNSNNPLCEPSFSVFMFVWIRRGVKCIEPFNENTTVVLFISMSGWR